MNTNKLLDPITPGEILREDFMDALDININHLARDLSVPPNRISEIVNGKRAITADTALRLQRYFGVEAQFWLNLQTEYDLRMMKLQRQYPRIDPCHNQVRRADGLQIEVLRKGRAKNELYNYTIAPSFGRFGGLLAFFFGGFLIHAVI